MKNTSLIIVMLLLLANMQCVAQNSSRTKIIAHRGAWKNTNLPQNSLGALNAAIDLGVFASECDIWMTVDSVLVVNHDPHFFDKPIESTTYTELLKTKYVNGESIATLEQFLLRIKKQKRTRLVLDIKPSKLSKERSIVTAQKSFAMVVAMKATTLIDYIFFDYDACLAIEKLDPNANIAYLLGDKNPEQVQQDGLWGIDYSFKVFQKNETWVADSKAKGLTVNVWTVNDQSLAESFIDQQVDFITTNEPEMLLKLVKKR